MAVFDFFLEATMFPIDDFIAVGRLFIADQRPSVRGKEVKRFEFFSFHYFIKNEIMGYLIWYMYRSNSANAAAPLALNSLAFSAEANLAVHFLVTGTRYMGRNVHPK